MTDYDLAAFTRDVTSARDEWRKDTRWPCGADARLSADLDYRQAVRDAAERFLSATRTALAVQQRATTDAVSEQERLSGQRDAARQALDEATQARDAAERAVKDLREEHERFMELASDRVNEAEARCTELEDAHDRLTAELAEEQAAHAALIAHALAVGAAFAPSLEGQGAAPELPPAPPLPVRKPGNASGSRTRKAESAAEPQTHTGTTPRASKPSEARTEPR